MPAGCLQAGYHHHNPLYVIPPRPTLFQPNLTYLIILPLGSLFSSRLYRHKYSPHQSTRSSVGISDGWLVYHLTCSNLQTLMPQEHCFPLPLLSLSKQRSWTLPTIVVEPHSSGLVSSSQQARDQPAGINTTTNPYLVLFPQDPFFHPMPFSSSSSLWLALRSHSSRHHRHRYKPIG